MELTIKDKNIKQDHVYSFRIVDSDECLVSHTSTRISNDIVVDAEQGIITVKDISEFFIGYNYQLYNVTLQKIIAKGKIKKGAKNVQDSEQDISDGNVSGTVDPTD